MALDAVVRGLHVALRCALQTRRDERLASGATH
jgi:hypothetical protein